MKNERSLRKTKVLYFKETITFKKKQELFILNRNLYLSETNIIITVKVSFA